MKKLFTTLTVLAFAVPLFLAQSANADVVCTPNYGGGETCISKGAISIDKKVRHPNSLKSGSDSFVDNLYINDSKYQAGDQIIFKLIVTNTGDTTLSSVEVKDTLPSYVTFVSGPGNFDANTKILTYTIKDLKAKESKTNTVVVKVVSEKELPIQNGTLCAVNQSFAKTDNSSDQDNAQFCVQKQVLGKVFPAPKITTTPPTGPEVIGLVGLIPAALAGFAIRKRANTFRGGEK